MSIPRRRFNRPDWSAVYDYHWDDFALGHDALPHHRRIEQQPPMRQFPTPSRTAPMPVVPDVPTQPKPPLDILIDPDSGGLRGVFELGGGNMMSPEIRFNMSGAGSSAAKRGFVLIEEL